MGKESRKEKHGRNKGRKFQTTCRKCGVKIVCWDAIDPICINCAIWG